VKNGPKKQGRLGKLAQIKDQGKTRAQFIISKTRLVPEGKCELKTIGKLQHTETGRKKNPEGFAKKTTQLD